MISKNKSPKASQAASSKTAKLKPHAHADELKAEFGRLAQWSIPLTQQKGRIPGKGSPSPLGWVASSQQTMSLSEEVGCEFAMTREGGNVSFRLIPRPRMPGGNWYVDVQFTATSGCSACVIMDLTAVLWRTTFELELDRLGIEHRFAKRSDESSRAAEAAWRKYLRDRVWISEPNELSGCDLAFWRGF